ncbi:MAG: Rad52/Rad22 family DNA repair protein [Nitrosomonadaceae bacterium]
MNIENELKKPFPERCIHWRVGATTSSKDKGIALAYIDARDVMERLDFVFGVGGWQCRYPFAGCCEIGAKIDGEWVWKSNGAGVTDYEAEKGQYSDAFKRAGVMWGVGQYLYGLPNEWVTIKPQGKSFVIATPPTLPQWATPNGYGRITASEKKEVYEQSIECLGNGDAEGLQQIWDEYDQEEKVQLWHIFDSKQRTAMKELK